MFSVTISWIRLITVHGPSHIAVHLFNIIFWNITYGQVLQGMHRCISDWKWQGSTGASFIYMHTNQCTILHSCTGCRKWLATMGSKDWGAETSEDIQGRPHWENGSFKLKVPGKTTWVEDSADWEQVRAQSMCRIGVVQINSHSYLGLPWVP